MYTGYGVNYDQTNWTEILPHAVFAINRTSRPQLNGISCLYYERGFNPLTPIDLIKTLQTKIQDECPKDVIERIRYLDDMRTAVVDSINSAERNYEHYYNLRRTPSEHINVGDLVRLKLDNIKLPIFKKRPKNKLNPIWYGPFRIIGQPSSVSYQLELPEAVKIHNTFHVSKLKLATDRSFSNLNKVVIPTELDDSIDYEVERLLDHKFDARTKQWSYLVQWKGFSPLFHSTWEPRDALSSAKGILRKYEIKNKISP
eukprot:SAG31_NODE_8126_length_1516_cov_11.954834_2_plen_257_part_00